MRGFHQSSPYKTISSDSETRHGTTYKKPKPRQVAKNKMVRRPRDMSDLIDQYEGKQYEERIREESGRESSQEPEPNHRNHHLNYLDEQIYLLRNLKQQQIHQHKYRAAEATQKRLKKALAQAKVECLRRLSLEHYQEKREVDQAHNLEMKKFSKVWSVQFLYFEERKRGELVRWQHKQQRDYDSLRVSLTHKYHSMRSHSRELIDMQKKEEGLIRQSRFKDLHFLRQQKKRLNRKLEKEKNQEFKRIVKLEDQKFRQTQTKRYNSLMIRVEDAGNDQRRNYNRDQLRLKHKYKNVLVQLQHAQTLEMNQLLGQSIL